MRNTKKVWSGKVQNVAALRGKMEKQGKWFFQIFFEGKGFMYIEQILLFCT